MRENHKNHKLTIVAVCGLGFSHLTGFLFTTQQPSMNISGVHGFVSFTVNATIINTAHLLVEFRTVKDKTIC